MEGSRSARAHAGGRWRRYEAAGFGFRHYWYPAPEWRKLGRRSRPLTLCGEKIALVRDHGKITRLAIAVDIASYRSPLARREFPDTLFCICHVGPTILPVRAVAELPDGPDSPVCGRTASRVKICPVQERGALIWVYVGDVPWVAVEDDARRLPRCAVQPAAASTDHDLPTPWRRAGGKGKRRNGRKAVSQQGIA